MNLLTLGNPKTARGEARGYLTGVIHLAPARLAGLDVPTSCPKSGACEASCLNTAGRGGIGAGSLAEISADTRSNAIQRARIRRTRAFWREREAFRARLEHEIVAADRRARRLGLRLALRPNGTSDLAALRVMVQEIVRTRGIDARVYDYTKVPAYVRDRSPRYHVTFSADGARNLDVARAMIARGVNVAVPWRGEATREVAARALASYFGAAGSVDGDAHDLRFLDPSGPIGYVVVLKAKGRAKRDPRFTFNVDAHGSVSIGG